MKDLLINCYYDGKTLKEALEFIASNYKYETVTEKQIQQAQKSIKACTGNTWK